MAGADAPRVVRFVPEADYGPFVFADADGRVRGLSIDVLQGLLRDTGVELRMLPPAPLAEQLKRMQAGDADLISSLRPTVERSRYLLFTKPYVAVPAIVVARRDAAGADRARSSLAAFEGRPVAVGHAYAVEAHVRARHPGVLWHAVPDDTVALRGVRDGRFDAAVVDAASARHVIERERLAGLEGLGAVDFVYELSFAVPRGRADLLAWLEARMARQPYAERQALVARWMPPLGADAAPPQARQAVQAGLGMLAASLVIAGLLWLRRRRQPAGLRS